MAGAQDRDDDSPGPHTDRSPGTVPEAVAVASGARRASGNYTPVGSDTLLSVPAPATGEEEGLVGEERLVSYERKLHALTRRVEALEKRSGDRGARGSRAIWMWLVFLAVLAVTWQVLERLR